MKKDLPNDNLDKFLKKSFEDYSENPPEGMWDQIRDNLKKPEPTAEVISGGFKKWMLASAATAVILIGALVAQHFYFNQKIDEIETSVAKQQEQIDKHIAYPSSQNDYDNSENTERPNELNTSNSALEKNTNQTEIVNTNPDSKKQVRLKDKSSSQQSPLPASGLSTQKEAPTFVERQNNRAPNESINEMTFVKKTNTDSNSNSIESTSSTLQNQNTVSNQNQNSNSKQTQNTVSNLTQEVHSSKEGEIIATALTLPSTLESLITPPLPVSSNFNFSLPKMLLPQITPVKKPRGNWSIGAVGGTFQITENLKSDFPNQRMERHLISQNQAKEISGTALTGGVSVSRTFGNWRLSSGVLLRNESLTQIDRHNPKYSDFRQNQGRQEREIDYELFSNIGIISMELELDKNSNESVQPDETIPVQITYDKSTNFVSIPLNLGYQFEKGNWVLTPQIGASFNRLRTFDFNLEVTTTHPKFDSDLKRKREKLYKMEFINSNSLDGLAGINVGYHLSNRWLVNLTPSYQFEITERNLHPDLKTDVTGLGATLGVNYYF